jgi:CRISPR/Cas system-associated protein Csx1
MVDYRTLTIPAHNTLHSQNKITDTLYPKQMREHMLLTMFITHICYTSQYHPTSGSIYITTQCNSSSQNERAVGSTLVNQFKQFRNHSISIIYFPQIQHNFGCFKFKCFWKVNYIYTCKGIYISVVSTDFFEVDLSYRVCNLTIHLWLSTVNHDN